MAVDLREVERAAHAARENFIVASKLDLDAYKSILIAYLDDFENAPVKRAETVRKAVSNAKEIANSYKQRFNDIVNEVALLIREQNAVVARAAGDTSRLIVEGFGSHLDRLTARLAPGPGAKHVPGEVFDREAVEKIKSRVAGLGYANALAQQLAANLVVDHLEAMNRFCVEYLREKSVLEAIRRLKSREVVEILSEVLTEMMEIPLLAPLKKLIASIDEKRAPKAGVTPGNTDIMFELQEILSQDFAGLNAVMAVLIEIRALSGAGRQ